MQPSAFIVGFTIDFIFSFGTDKVFHSFKVATWRPLPTNTKRLFGVDSQEDTQ